jgi:hypothetical protein
MGIKGSLIKGTFTVIPPIQSEEKVIMDQPPYVQAEPFVNPINNINEFYDSMIRFSVESTKYPYQDYEFSLSIKNLDANINLLIKKAEKYFSGDDRDIIIGYINQAKQYLIDGENLKAAHSFTDVCTHMHIMRER